MIVLALMDLLPVTSMEVTVFTGSSWANENAELKIKIKKAEVKNLQLRFCTYYLSFFKPYYNIIPAIINQTFYFCKIIPAG